MELALSRLLLLFYQKTSFFNYPCGSICCGNEPALFFCFFRLRLRSRFDPRVLGFLAAVSSMRFSSGTSSPCSEISTSTSNLFEKKVTVSIVNGDLRFTSGSHLSTSAILLAAPTSGTTPFGVGRLPAIANVEAPVASKLPPDTIIDKRTGLEMKNIGQMAYDNGNGVIRGRCNGTISYNSGAIQLTNAPANANFVVNANYGSSQSGGNRFGASEGNSIAAINGRSCNSKIDTTIEIIGLK